MKMGKNKKHPEQIKLTSEEASTLKAEISGSNLSDKNKRIVSGVIDFSIWLQQSLQQASITIKILKSLFGFKSEKKSNLKKKDYDGESEGLEGSQTAGNESDDTDDSDKKKEPGEQEKKGEKPKPLQPGHGQIKTSDYIGSKHVHITHQSLKIGDKCLNEHCGGRVNAYPSGVIVIITGHAPLTSTRYTVEKLRCKLCEKIYQADVPFDYDIQKVSKVYDHKAIAIIALEKYALGMPNHRLEQFQASLGVPIPDSTQWDKISTFSEECGKPIFEVLEDCGAQGDLSYRDDTPVKILSVINELESGKDGRKGTFTTGITSIFEGHVVQLYYNGVQHCGENFADLMEKRDPETGEMICQADALPANNPKSLSPGILIKLVICYCLVHARRNFFKIKDFFEKECEYVLSVLSEVYKNDAFCKDNKYDDFKRLEYHKKHSKPLMDTLYKWLTEYISKAENFEENSSLGKAMLYFVNHWNKLTKFLYVVGAPLDNNVVERALRFAIRLRKASLFFKTLNGARIGNIFMSLINTCNVNNINPFHYLVTIQDNKQEVAANPKRWLPWNYQNNANVTDVHIRDG